MTANEEHKEDPPKKERVKKYLFKRPKPLNSWGHQEHRSESWMELFIDLFYVAFFIKLGDILHVCGADIDIMTLVATFFLGVNMAKFDFDQYMNKFATEDLLHKIFFSIYSMGLVVMILDVNETSKYGDNDYEDKHRLLAASGDVELPLHCPEVHSYVAGFTAGWMITRSSLLLMYCIIAFYVHPQGKYLLISKAPILILSQAVMLINYFIPPSDNYVHTYIVMAAALVEFLGWALWEVLIYGSWVVAKHGREVLIPTNIHHHASRTGTFVMLVLGEAVIALLTPTLLNAARIYTFTLLSSLLVFMLAVMYFDVQPQQHAAHALGISRGRGMAWISLHPLLAFMLFGVGVSLKLIYEDRRSHIISDYNEKMLGVFLGGAIFVMAVLRATHKVVFTRGGIFTLSLRLMIAALHVVVGAIALPEPIQTDEWKIGVHCMLSFVAVLVDTWKYRHIDMTIMTLPESTANKRGSVRRSIPPTPGSRTSVSRQKPMNVDGCKDNVAGPPRLRRSVSNPTEILRSFHKDGSKIKQIRQMSVSGVHGISDLQNKSFNSLQQRRASAAASPRLPTSRNQVVTSDESLALGDVQMQDIPPHDLSEKQASPTERRRVQQGVSSDIPESTDRNGYERTRVFEYDDNGNLVEVVDDGNFGDDNDAYDYEEEYIEVVYEGGEDETDFDDNSIHIVLEEPDEQEDVASHITWL